MPSLAFETSKQVLGTSLNLEKSLKALNEFSLSGRFQVKNKDPYFIIDTAHNPDAIRSLINSLKQFSNDWVLICGFTHGHLHEESIELLKNFASHIIFYRAR